MTRLIVTLAAAAALLPWAPARAQRPEAEPAFAQHLFAPELVMQHQAALGLSAQQRTAITDAIKQLQGEVLDAQWQIQEAAQRLAELLSAPRVDAAAALVQADRIFTHETAIKRLHMATLIRIKNTLTPEQQKQLARHQPGRQP